MLCERYKKALMRAGLGEPLSAALQGHLAECTACRATFAADQSLVASLDISLRDRTSVEVPPGFLSRVMTRVADEASPVPSWSYAWTAVAATAVLGMAIGLAWNFWRSTAARLGGDTMVANRSLPSTEESMSPAATAGNAALPTHAERRTSRKLDSEGNLHVLVSADGRAATVELIENIQRGKIDGKALVSEAYQDLKILPMVIPPLPSLSGEPDSGEPPDTSGLPVNTGDTNRRTK
jgi:hypothetical protein